MSDFLDKMIADLKEGASRSEGFIRGGHVGVEVARERRGREEKLATIAAPVQRSYEEGAKAAADRFKVAFLPLLGSLAGGALLRGGLGMAARRFGGNALGRAAQGTLNWAGKGGMRGGALDMTGSMAGGALGSQLQGPPQQ